jgi:hypothetical protein
MNRKAIEIDLRKIKTDAAIVSDYINKPLKSTLLDMLGFQHIQRNFYSHELRESDVRQKASEVVELVPVLNEHLRKFT